MTSIALQPRAWSPSSSEATRTEVDFEQLVHAYSKDLYRYGYWLAGDKHTAEDLVQDTLLRAWRSRHSVKDPQAIKAWLLTILRRENARRFERYQPKRSDVAPEELQSGDRGYDTSTEAFVLRRALNELPEEYREPLLLQVIDGYSQKEIAAQLGISSAGVGTRLFRARQKLRDILGAEQATV